MGCGFSVFVGCQWAQKMLEKGVDNISDMTYCQLYEPTKQTTGMDMDKRKKKALESKGYKVGSVEEFLGLSPEESEYIELKLAFSQALAKRRKQSKLKQAQLAKMLKSSQSRVAKMEKGDPSVSVDLLVKSLLAMGANKESIAKAII